METILVGLAAILVFLGVRTLFLVLNPINRLKSAKKSCKTLIVLGSGGHTGEMFPWLETLDPSVFTPRTYIVAQTDKGSAEKAKAFEKKLGKEANIQIIPRSREVGQSYFTSVFTTLKALLSSFVVVAKAKPDLILTNGPGTCVPICFSAFVLKVLGLQRSRIVFAESFACVHHLSLSGKLLYFFANRFFVQWKGLAKKYKRAEYTGRLTKNETSAPQPTQTSRKKSFVFVTVGSTRFDELIKEVDRPSFVEHLKKAGYAGLHIQYGGSRDGKATYVPSNIKSEDNFEVQMFAYKDFLHEETKGASLVISHAGAGSILETLAQQKPLIVVPNERLMNNHQLELAEKLARKGYLVYSKLQDPSGRTLDYAIADIDKHQPKIFPSISHSSFSSLLNEEIGVIQ
eukprot:TRINITY_DN8062_c0_g1_i1.p1 TRINITY_DN8062_c0_g1~~TRINITY_DN8062_c0_g1_i1.p1  ORF type:complete len:401 (-),score=60.72 TRINITY_DN8062_c0_g1_i1:44-1246(-)